MKIIKTEDNLLIFDNGERITCTHNQDCCEYNYAAFPSLDDIALNATFTSPLSFELVPDSGFRFGNLPNNMHFVPCYSEQNGYYSDDLEVYYNDQKVLYLTGLYN